MFNRDYTRIHSGTHRTMKIAIVKLSALGDIVHAMVALQMIKQARPDLIIDWVVEQRFADVLKFNPDIHAIQCVNIKSLKTNKTHILSELNKIRHYAAQNYDLVIDAQGLIKSSVVSRLLCANTAGFNQDSIREKAASWLYSNKVACRYDANTIDRNVKVISEPLGIQVTREQILNKKPFLFFQQPQQDLLVADENTKPCVIYFIGSTWPSRNYPKEQYLKVIQGVQCQAVIAWGNQQEKQDAQWIVEHSDGKARLLPQMSLNDLKAVISQADLVIGNDTGPTHMAWALNRPSITLFGPTPVSRVYQTHINRVLKSPSQVNPYKLDKNDFSIKQINKNEIIELAQSLLSIDTARH